MGIPVKETIKKNCFSAAPGEVALKQLTCFQEYNYLRQRRLMSSRVLPLVSGTKRQTKRAARMQMVP